jgi:hypothetical protein
MDGALQGSKDGPSPRADPLTAPSLPTKTRDFREFIAGLIPYIVRPIAKALRPN